MNHHQSLSEIVNKLRNMRAACQQEGGEIARYCWDGITDILPVLNDIINEMENR